MMRLTFGKVKCRRLRCTVAGKFKLRSRPESSRKRILACVYYIFILHQPHNTFTKNIRNGRPILCGCAGCDFPRGLYSHNIEQRYCRTCTSWFNRTCLDGLNCRMDTSPRTNLTPEFDNIRVEKEFLEVVAMPILRGGPHGVVGNAQMFVEANSLLKESKTLGRLPYEWKDRLKECAPRLDTENIVHYRCPVCKKAVLC